MTILGKVIFTLFGGVVGIAVGYLMGYSPIFQMMLGMFGIGFMSFSIEYMEGGSK